MHVKAQCSNPDCGHQYNLSPELVGKTVRCKECQQTFTVTAVNAASVRESRVKKSDTSVVAPADARRSRAAGSSPQRLGRFEVYEKLGGGAFGVVFRAFDPQLEREVALKVPRPGTLDDAEAVERFLREAKAAAQLRHPNIVPIYDAGRDGEQYYIASAFISGHPLEHAVEAGAVEPRRAARIVRELAEAFDYAHSQGILHRDIKPANVMLDDKDHPHVMDFGLARLDTAAAKLTQDGTVMGTPAYMSPEQAAGDNERVAAASDQYSLGVLFYELLTGQTPFSGPPQIVIVNVLTQTPKPPRALKPDVPRDLETICLKAMAKEPEHRYGSCREFAEDLRRWLAGEPITARRVSYAERLVRWCQRNRVLASLVATAALLLVAVAVVSTVSAVRLKDLADRERNETKRANTETENAERERTKALELAAANATLAEQEKSAADNALQQTKLAQRNLYAAHMNLAQIAWEDSRIDAVLDLLDRWRPPEPLADSDENSNPATRLIGRQAVEDDLRGFEWYYWDRLCHSYLRELKGHTSRVSSVAFSVDGNWLASASDDTTVKVWDAATGRETHTLKGHTGPVYSMALSMDGKRLASAGGLGDSTVKVWDVASGQEMRTLKGHMYGVFSVAFGPDGKRLASAGGAGVVKVWDATSGQETLMWKADGHVVSSMAFSPDGKRLATAGNQGAVKVWDATSGREMLTWKGHTYQVFGVTFSPDGGRLASAGDTAAKVWDATSGQEKFTLKGHTGGWVSSVAFSADGKRVVSAGIDQTVMVWDATSGQRTLTLKGHTGGVLSVAFSADGKRLVSGSFDGTVKVWDASRGQEMLTLKGPTSEVRSVAFSPDGQRLLADGYQNVRVWDLTCGQEMLTLKRHAALLDGIAARLDSVAFSADGKRLASTGGTQTVKVWDVATGQEALVLNGHTGIVTRVAFSPDGKWLASASHDTTVKVWDATSGQETLTLKGHTRVVTSVAFSVDGKRLASASHDQTVKVWDATSGQETLTMKGHSGDVTTVAFSRDGKRLASGSADQTVKLWDATNGQETRTLNGRTGSVICVAFSADGKRLASASAAFGKPVQVKVWDVNSGQETLTLKGNAIGNVITGTLDETTFGPRLVFSPDGNRLASAFHGSDVKVWDARPWTPELRVDQESTGLIRFLFDKGLSKEGVLKAIAADATITDLVRQRATELAGPLADNLAR